MPAASRIPISSAGVVSEDTRIVSSPSSSTDKTMSADKQRRPDAAPGLAGVPEAITWRSSDIDSKLEWLSCCTNLGSTAATASHRASIVPISSVSLINF